MTRFLVLSGPACRFTAALLCAFVASANAQTGLAEHSPLQDQGLKPEASFEHRIDPWSRLTLRLQADPSLGIEASEQAGIDVRLVTERLDAHELQAGAALSLSPAVPDTVQAWQAFDEDRSSVFVQDRWQLAPEVSLTAGARLVSTPDGGAVHDRLVLSWQPADDWTVRLTDGSVRPASLPPGGLRVHRFQGVELRTEQSAGIVQLQARLASRLVNDVLQPQTLHALALALSAPLDDHWTIGGDSLITSQGNLMRLKLSGSMVHDRARLSLVVPRRLQGRTIDPALSGGLPSLDGDGLLGWRTQLEVWF